MERSSHCLIISLLVVVLADGHTVEMTLGPGKAPIPAQKYLLLPKADGQTDADAMPLYEKAVQLLPEDSQIDRISQWLKIPPSKLPREQVQATLEQFEPILQLLEQAAKCRHCNWPYWDSEICKGIAGSCTFLPYRCVSRFPRASLMRLSAPCKQDSRWQSTWARVTASSTASLE
jgi:hypothetical protein